MSPDATFTADLLIIQNLHVLYIFQVISPMDGGPDIEIWQKEGVPTGKIS